MPAKPTVPTPARTAVPPPAPPDLRNDSEIEAFFDVALDLLGTAGFDGYFRRLNPRWTQILGWSEAELKAAPFLDFVHPDDREATLAAAARLSGGDNVVEFENRYRAKDGAYHWISWNSYAAADRRMILFAARDVCDRKQLEDELRAHRDDLERRVAERTQELVRAQELLTRQAEEILEIATPILQVWEGVVVAPLIGSLDSRRAEQFTDRLLQAIVETRSAVALVDITGVPAIDTQCARFLLEATEAVRLLGARVIMTGIRPPIARTLVHLGVDLSRVVTCATLLAGLKKALEIARPAEPATPPPAAT